MKILIVSATPFEIDSCSNYLNQNFEKVSDFQFKKGEIEITLLITGVGLTLTAYHLTKTLIKGEYNLCINAGIAGALNQDLKIGDVVQVVSEEFGDLGVEEANGQFSSVIDMGLIEPNQLPFTNGVLENKAADAFNFLPKVKSQSVNKVHGSAKSIEDLKSRSNADIESMEGAAFFYVSLMEELPFLEIRSISNYVEPRNKDNWDIPLAIGNLNKVLLEIISFFTAESML